MKTKSAMVFLLSLILSPRNRDRNQAQQTQKDQQQSTKDARAARRHLHERYMQYSALSPQEKIERLKNLIQEHIRPDLRHKSDYTNHYQYEAERLGFAHFLRYRGMECDSLQINPEFVEEAKSYIAKCKVYN